MEIYSCVNKCFRYNNLNLDSLYLISKNPYKILLILILKLQYI